MPTKKRGRPTDNPRSHKLSIRLNDQSQEILERYCARESVNKTTAIERGIAKLEDELKK